MPHELTRALRWGWEFLLELQASDALTPDQRVQVGQLLLHYPSANDVKAWAAVKDTDSFENILGVEDDDVSRATVAQDIDRPPVTVEQYMLAIREAGLFFRELRGAGNLPEAIRRQVPYVLRHFPQSFHTDAIEELVVRAAKER
jgi:hypothetical protein